MVKVEDILAAHYNCRKGKASSPDCIKFEMRLFENITELTEQINSRAYAPLPSITFVVSRPVYREVFAANYRDRVIHHYISLRLEPLFESVFNDRTYNCRVGKGQLYGVNRLAADVRACSVGYTKPCWYLKCDMKGFFMSIPRRNLADKVDDFIVTNYKGEDLEDLRYLSRATIMNDPAKGCINRSSEEEIAKVPVGKTLRTSRPGHGLPIGNLTSQHDANFWLNDFDWWMETTMGFIYHGRYVDDFVLVSECKRRLLEAIPKFRAYLSSIDITLHPRKLELQSAYKGIKFTGMIVKRERIYASNRMVSNFEQLIHHMNTLPIDYSIEQLEHYVCSINSYLGLMRYCDSYAIRKRIMLKMDRRFYRELYIKGRYKMVRIKKRFRRSTIAKNAVKKKRNFEILMDDYYNERHADGKRNHPMAG